MNLRGAKHQLWAVLFLTDCGMDPGCSDFFICTQARLQGGRTRIRVSCESAANELLVSIVKQTSLWETKRYGPGHEILRSYHGYRVLILSENRQRTQYYLI